ncbi:hypothetical protein LINGRAHAP2_LOCUS30001 [Linum grandiflorum]
MKLVVGENLLSEPSYKLFNLMYIRSPKTSRSQKSQVLRREDHHNSLPKREGHGMSTRQQNVREVILLHIRYIMHYKVIVCCLLVIEVWFFYPSA